MKLLSSWLHRRPYKLSKSPPKMVNGVPLYQLIATKGFEIRMPHQRNPQRIAEGEYGGWVPSLDVLEQADGRFPWLDEKSHIATTETVFRGSLYFVNSQWNGTGSFDVSSDRGGNAWVVQNSSFTGTNTISLTVPSFKDTYEKQWYNDELRNIDESIASFYEDLQGGASTMLWKNLQLHDVSIQGPSHINDSVLKNVRIFTRGELFISHSHVDCSEYRNATPGCAQINDSRWHAVSAHKGSASDVLRVTNCTWNQVQFHTSDDEDLYYGESYDVVNSTLTNVAASHGTLSNTHCHNPSETPLDIPLPCEGLPQLHANTRCVPIQQEIENAPCITHLVWYKGRTHEPVRIHDVVHQHTISVTGLAEYLDTLRAHTNSPSHQRSAGTLEWWKWQDMLGVEPPADQAWVRPPEPVVLDTSASFAFGDHP